MWNWITMQAVCKYLSINLIKKQQEFTYCYPAKYNHVGWFWNDFGSRNNMEEKNDWKTFEEKVLRKGTVFWIREISSFSSSSYKRKWNYFTAKRKLDILRLVSWCLERAFDWWRKSGGYNNDKWNIVDNCLVEEEMSCTNGAEKEMMKVNDEVLLLLKRWISK